MACYDDTFLAEYEYRYPGQEGLAQIPAGLTIMSESWLCPYCRETLWFAEMPDEPITDLAVVEAAVHLTTVQDLCFFDQPGFLGEHTAEYCERHYYGQMGMRGQSLTREYNQWAVAHGYPSI